ncbi:hypothetical protein JNUCC31_17680 [Paenibacillus sp. JNUCC31]|uniref:hypothetical protein n=1 Tax=Paenibacillus sp. JNUCC-31 TaxID=2777983 RepID=UPI00177F0378|nr:hypothetical protein [Paenibacillus sp. JNUCC-31]QOS76680.1 hypothetical protein JNUCC31_17680 [Paenibacillus sp. JNUCC-31]
MDTVTAVAGGASLVKNGDKVLKGGGRSLAMQMEMEPRAVFRMVMEMGQMEPQVVP